MPRALDREQPAEDTGAMPEHGSGGFAVATVLLGSGALLFLILARKPLAEIPDTFSRYLGVGAVLKDLCNYFLFSRGGDSPTAAFFLAASLMLAFFVLHVVSSVRDWGRGRLVSLWVSVCLTTHFLLALFPFKILGPRMEWDSFGGIPRVDVVVGAFDGHAAGILFAIFLLIVYAWYVSVCTGRKPQVIHPMFVGPLPCVPVMGFSLLALTAAYGDRVLGDRYPEGEITTYFVLSLLWIAVCTFCAWRSARRPRSSPGTVSLLGLAKVQIPRRK